MRSAAVLVAAILFLSAAAHAAGPGWMPNFPMRMGAAGAMLMWMPVPGATEYKVMRKLDDGEWVQVSKGPMNNFQDPAAPQDKDVTYKVIAVVGGADGEPSKEVTLAGLKPIDPPSNLAHRLLAAEKHILVRWGVVSGASFYNVYRSGAKDGAFDLLGSVQENKYTDTTVEDTKTYYYVVTSVSSSSQESVRPDPYEVTANFPKQVVVKKFDPVRRQLTFLKTVYGEDFAEIKNPTDLLVTNGRIFIVEENGVQILDMEGSFTNRMEVMQEQVANRAWNRPMLVAQAPGGTLFFTHINTGLITEFSPDGTRLVSEITVPDLPGSKFPSRPGGLAFAPNGDLWISDEGLGNLMRIPAGLTAPTNDEVERFGWVRGSDVPYGEATGLKFPGPSMVRYLPEYGLLGIMHPRPATVVFFDVDAKEIKGEIGGQGGGLHKFKSIGHFQVYDDTSVLMLDVLDNSIRRIDRTNGDYLESWVDSEDKLNLQQGKAVLRLHFDTKTKRLYVLSFNEQALYLYDVQ